MTETGRLSNRNLVEYKRNLVEYVLKTIIIITMSDVQS